MDHTVGAQLGLVRPGPPGTQQEVFGRELVHRRVGVCETRVGADFLDFVLLSPAPDEVPSCQCCAGCYDGYGDRYCYGGCGAF